MRARLSNFSTVSLRMSKGRAGMLPARSGILPDSMERAPRSYPTRTGIVRRQHAGGSGQSARAPQS